MEAALRLREAHGGTVAAVTMGPPQAEEALKKARWPWAATRAYLLSDRAFGGADTLATSYVLSKAAEKMSGFDLLIFGRHAVDGDTARQARLRPPPGYPQVTLVSALEVEDGRAPKGAWLRSPDGPSEAASGCDGLRQHKQAPAMLRP